MSEISAFSDDKFNPFEFKADSSKYAILIHGFPGTPYEMRMIGQLLNDQSYTAKGILLPGFGSDIKTLENRTREDWFSYVEKEVIKVQEISDELIIVGYSFGAAITINAIVENDEINPDKVILIAPFWNVFGQFRPVIRFFGPIIWRIGRLFSPDIKVYNNIDFNNPSHREDLQDTFDNVDLDDPEVQQFIKSISIPFKVLDEIYKIGRNAKINISKLDIPILVLQGANDSVVPPHSTNQLLTQNELLEYHLLPKLDHEFLKPDRYNRNKIDYIITGFLR